MKLPLLPACLAAITTVSAAALKEPVEVSREWNQTIEQVRASAVPVPTLTAQTETLMPLPRIFSPLSTPPAKSLRNTPLYDAPSHRRLRKLPHDRPGGTMPWDYNNPAVSARR